MFDKIIFFKYWPKQIKTTQTNKKVAILIILKLYILYCLGGGSGGGF